MQISTSFSQQDIDKMRQRAFSTNIPDDPGLRTYFFTNDRYLSDQKNFVRNHLPATNDDKNACALIVGSGAALSFLDVLPRTIIFTDKDSDLLVWLYFLVETVRKEQDLERAKDIVGLRDFQDGLDRLPLKLIEHEQASLREDHFLASQAVYEKVRTRLDEHNFVYAAVDYADGLELATLAHILKMNDSFITIANMTNLHPYLSYNKRYNHQEDSLDEELLAFQTLPLDNKAVFLTRPLDEKDYYIEPLIGVEAYIATIRELIRTESEDDHKRWSHAAKHS